MTKEFIPYEQALALKELGFDEPCFGCYNNGELVFSSHINNVMQRFRYSAPTYSQAFSWFREKYDLQYNIVWNKFYDKTPYQYEVRPTWRNEPLRPYGTSGMCSTYEEAELECLKELIKIVKRWKKS